MRVPKVASLIAVGIVIGSLLSAAPAGATVIKPTVTGFSSSTTMLYKTGGTITLSATITNATSCVFTSNKTITGMPYGVTPCVGLVAHDVTLPVNTGKHPAVYTFKLSATGARTTNAKPTIKVMVATLPAPPPPPPPPPPSPPPPPPIQLAPTSGTVSTTESAAFNDQLNLSGGYGAITFATTVPNSGLSVSSTGAISTTGVLATGDHTVRGTMTDLAPAVGTWTYTLAVTGAAPTGVSALAAGLQHTCALTSGGTVWCWGRGSEGQLGNGANTTVNSVPVTVKGLSGATAIAAGHDHTCALVSGDTVQCWGNNGYGQLGNGTTTDSNVPVTVSGL